MVSASRTYFVDQAMLFFREDHNHLISHTIMICRFAPELHKSRHPQAWMPFGVGPRNCVGQRFAVIEFKVALALLIKNFTLHQCEETQEPLELLEKVNISPKDGITLKIVAR